MIDRYSGAQGVICIRRIREAVRRAYRRCSDDVLGSDWNLGEILERDKEPLILSFPVLVDQRILRFRRLRVSWS